MTRRPVGAARTWLLAVLAAAAGTLVLASAASAAPLYGIQGIDNGPKISPHTTSAELDRARALHVALIRVEVFWSELEPKGPSSMDARTLASIDRVVDGAARRHIKVVLFVDRTPCWASSAPASLRRGCAATHPNTFAVTSYPPTDPRTYVPVARFLVARYGTKLAAFEVWNEPDQSNQKYWAGPDKLKRYVALVKDVYGPLKTADPALQVLVGSFVGTNGVWLQQMYDAGIKGFYDGLAVHFYDLPLAALRTTRAVQLKNGDAKPLWLTEFGWTSCYAAHVRVEIDHPCVTTAVQEQNLVDTMRSIRRVDWVRAAIVYDLKDDRHGYQFGLVSAVGKPKRAYAAVKRVIAGVPVAVRRPTAHLRIAGKHLVAFGRASGIDLFKVRVYEGNGSQRVLREVATVRTTPLNAWTLPVSSQLGTSQISLTITGEWPGLGTASAG